MAETEFGRYRLVKRLAVGGMAEIWLARQAGPGGFEKHLVIKRILDQYSADEDFVSMFLDEARLAAQLSHPNIAQVMDFGQEADTYYIAMELVRGPDLRRLLRACKKGGVEFPFRLAARIMSQTCAALDYAHKAVDGAGNPLNIIHRDVSPQNIMVSLDGNTKLVDFGIAKAKSQGQHTNAGVVKGKFAYMAPEQIKGRPLDARADVYAAGLVLYEMLTGELALKGDGQLAILNAIESNIQPAGELRPDLPAGLLAVLDSALQKDRDRRFPDADAMEGALELYLASLGKPVNSREIAEFMKGVQIDSGDPLSVAGTGSFGRAALPVEARSSPSLRVPAQQPAAPEPEKTLAPGPIDHQVNQATVMQAAPDEGEVRRAVRRPARREEPEPEAPEEQTLPPGPPPDETLRPAFRPPPQAPPRPTAPPRRRPPEPSPVDAGLDESDARALGTKRSGAVVVGAVAAVLLVVAGAYAVFGRNAGSADTTASKSPVVPPKVEEKPVVVQMEEPPPAPVEKPIAQAPERVSPPRRPRRSPSPRSRSPLRSRRWRSPRRRSRRRRGLLSRGGRTGR